VDRKKESEGNCESVAVKRSVKNQEIGGKEGGGLHGEDGNVQLEKKKTLAKGRGPRRRCAEKKAMSEKKVREVQRPDRGGDMSKNSKKQMRGDEST